ncbi:MAG: single-stranded-DNA-specific exonuclease RecJ [Chloroflexota bacterium]|nr:single-stranded-DNA-specific exonuclease RecJ [Chloroflexota bacterium]MDE2941848.1 single-stranded-DNA-specific exonuclease RecJ [Chloroflexota bacterium]MDE3268320.1 single-stranded-DNA-specific exonuclease RecJ [Chloroflexota bacterium]
MEPFSPLAAQLLHNRGITDPADAAAFLARDERLLEDPVLLPGMTAAVARLRAARDAGETIGVFGDFDADGVTGTALLAEGLEQLGASVIPYLPHRVTEGHGLSSQAVHALRGKGTSLIVTVDCGVASFDEVAEAASLGVDTIITDHHSPPPLLPEALAIVNPRLYGSTYPNPGLAGVGLAFKLVQGLCDSLGLRWSEQLLQLAALGTVTDVTPLVGENRYIVAAGLRSMNADPKPGLRELLRAGGKDGAPVDTEAVSFVLGPRLNAPGRLGHAITAYNLLRASSPDEAIPYADELQRLNRERQELMGRAIDHAKAQVESVPAEEPLLMLWSEEYAAGIVGLLASRLSEERYRPAVVAAVEGDLARGSARSIPEFNLASALEECSDLFVRYGGHPRAAGFVARCEVLPELRSRLGEIAKREIGHLQLQPSIRIDAHVRLSTLNAGTLRFLEELAPFGEGNPAPVFITRGASVLDASRIGTNGQHLRLRLRHDGAVWSAIAFGMGEAWQEGTELIDVVYSLGLDRWNGREAMRLVVHDFRPSGT